MKSWLIFFFFSGIICLKAQSQDNFQVIKGVVTDNDTGMPIYGAYVIELNSSPVNGTSTDLSGKFSIKVRIGRVSLKISSLGFDDIIIRDVLVGSGKEVILPVGLTEKVIQTEDVVVSADKSRQAGINQMATISTSTIRTDDALRYAGGFYDPSRIVNAFAGVVTSNSDYSNDIVIRGNSSRGLLWRLEGIEIPNPNHFSDGQGGSGGAFSAITSNVITNFDFFTGAFPAEFGNAFSGVVDLNLRKGNPDKAEYAFQTGMIGAEISVEGPFSAKSDASYLLNCRYTNFKILESLKLIDLGESNYAPRTKDAVLNISLPSGKAGTFNFFGVAGSSEIGKVALHDFDKWTSLSDRWEEMETQGSFIGGIKHLYPFKNHRTYLRTVLAYTRFINTYREGYIDSSYISKNSFNYDYDFPAARFSSMINHKINSQNTIRGGLVISSLSGDMENMRAISEGVSDTLVLHSASANLYQAYFQWKNKPRDLFEINYGLHLLEFSQNGQVCIEPRLGFRLNVTPGSAVTGGFGVHSRTESLAVYNSLVKNPDGTRAASNRTIGLSRSIHWVGGLDLGINETIRLKVEGYLQYLFDIPIVNKITSQYSTLNSSERLSDADLENDGTGLNKGVEITMEKSYSENYYLLATVSLFDSWYKAGDQRKYNTYYNTGYVTNLLAGKDFYVGKNKRNSIGLNIKSVFRGGYRYTPVDEKKTMKNKRIIYKTTSTYGAQLPDYFRLDAGINFRRNHPGYSWIIMLDIQNATNRKNVFRRRFTYENGKIISNDILSLGIVPVFNFRIEF